MSKFFNILSVLFVVMLAVGCRAPGELGDDDDDIDFDTSKFDTDNDKDTDSTDTDQTDSDSETEDAGFLCPENPVNVFENKFSPIFGGEQEIRVEVAAFSYFRCSHCAKFSAKIRQLWSEREDFRKYVRFYFHHFPLSSSVGVEVHAATVAAHQQNMDAFWQMHDYIFDGMLAEDPKTYSPEDLKAYAQDELQLDMSAFDEVVEDEDTENYILWDKQQAKDAGATGTPAVYVCGEKVPWGTLEAAVDKYLSH